MSGISPRPDVINAAEPECGAHVRDILSGMDDVLRRAGGAPEDVVKTVDFLVPAGLPTYRETAQMRRDYFQGRFPASTGILMENSIRRGAAISVDATAYVGMGSRRETVPADERAKRLTFRAGVERGGLLWISGTTGRRFDPEAGAEVYPEDQVAQVQIIYEKQLRALEELGYSYSDVVKTVDYLVPSALPTYRETAGVRRHFFGERFPVSTGVIVNRLLRPQALVEIDMVAVKGEREVINPGWSRYDRYTYVPGIKVNDLVFMSGFGNLDPSRNDLRGDDDLPTQTERCYSQVAAVVEAAGGSLDDVVKVVEYLTPAAIAEIDNLLPARRGFLKDNSYALTQTVVHSLLIPQMLIEVEAVAVLG